MIAIGEIERLIENRIEGHKEEIIAIIVNHRIKPVFQPIVSLRDGSILGYEALSRIEGTTSIQSIEDLFHLAAQNELLWKLEQECRKRALEKVFSNHSKYYDKQLFLNVSPLVIHDTKFKTGFTKEYLNRYEIDPEQVVFELTEQDSAMDIEGFQNAVEHYKQQSYEIAIDDLGSCYSGLNLVCELQPHYIKIDMKLIRDVHKNRSKYALVKGLMEFSAMTNVKLIAEGIETKEELEALINVGIHYGQGYFLARPDKEIKEIEESVIHCIKDYNLKKHSMHNFGVDSFYVMHICSSGFTIPENMKVETVLNYFTEKTEIPRVCIVNEKRVMGILTREKLHKILSGRYGFSLHQNKEISEIMDKDFLEVDYLTPISTVSAIAMDRGADNLYDFVVVTQAGQYYGIVTVKDLLTKATEITVNTAKSLNPLSGLPGNLLIDQEMRSVISGHLEYTVMYLDMDNFKAFNDVYGFERGDRVIKIMAELLQETVGEKDFIGHVGGDDFVVILYHNQYKNLTEKIKNEFEKRTHILYSEEDRRRGYVTTKNRHGEVEQYPLLSVTIALTTDKEKAYCSNYELAEELAIRKKIEKQQKNELPLSDDRRMRREA